MHGRKDAKPAIGQVGHQRPVLKHVAAKDWRGSQEQDQDGAEGNRRDDEAEGQRGQNTAIVQPGQEHDRQHDERPLVQPLMPRHDRHGVDQEAHGDRIRRLKHRVGEDEVEADIEGHQRADDMLGLRVLPACRRDG